MTIYNTWQSSSGSWRETEPAQQGGYSSTKNGNGGKGGKGSNSKRARLNSPRTCEDGGKGNAASSNDWRSTGTPATAAPLTLAHSAGQDWRPSLPKADYTVFSSSQLNGTYSASAPADKQKPATLSTLRYIPPSARVVGDRSIPNAGNEKAEFGGDTRSMGMRPIMQTVKQEQPYNNGQVEKSGYETKESSYNTKGKGKGQKGKGKGKDSWDVKEEPQKKGGKDGKGKGRAVGFQQNASIPPPPPPLSIQSTSQQQSSALVVPSSGANNFQSRTTSTTRQFLTDQRFDSLQIMPEMKRAIKERMNYEFMTEVQHQTLPTILAGRDVFARAKTGTGKTLGFLIPSVQKIAALQSGNQPKILGLCLSPTRELAMQIYEECKAITQFMPKFNVAIIYGGTPMQKDHKLFKSRVDLLVATPGRLHDHLQNSYEFADKIKSIHTLILDEADQLLEIGFRDAITKIIAYLPSNRQSLLFSATVAKEVRKVAGIALKNDYEFKDCVGDDTEATVQHATQSVMTVELEETFSKLTAIVSQAMAAKPDNYKIIVFFITARQTQCLAHAFNNYGIEVGDIHSRKSQAQRTKCSDWFRNCAKGILFSSDVSARGMDYPNVTHVIQFGVPANREQYIHRLGRTARAGAEGEGILVLHPHDNYFLRDIADLPLKKIDKVEMEKQLAPYLPEDQWIEEAMRKVPYETRAQCYSAWLGFYNGLCPKRVRWSKAELVEWANYFATDTLLCNKIPALMKKTVGKMGIKGTPGLVLQ